MAHGKKSRRDVMKVAGTLGAGGLASLAGCSGGSGGDGSNDSGGDSGGGDSGSGSGGDETGEGSYPELGNYKPEMDEGGGEVTFGFNVPQSGAYAAEGKDELQAYQLAKKHLNNGGGWVDMWEDLSGDGVNGNTVTSVNGDTATDPKQASEQASRMIRRDNALMISGGVSSSVAIAQQKLCQKEKVQFMACLTHSNATQGADCVRYGFREMFNAYMTGKALAPVLADEFGTDMSFYQLYADYTWGTTVRNSMREFLKEAGWTHIDSVPTPLGTSDFSTYMQDVPRDETDALVLIHFGADGANSVPQAFKAGLDEDMEIIVPLYDKIMATSASEYIGGVYGTADWNWQLDNEYANTFTEAFESEYDKKPSYAARLAYTQTLQYAAAVERAGTFYPPEVIKELEDHKYSNAGLGGEEHLRKCDHQAMREALVVQGRPPSEQTDGKLLKIVGTTSADDVGYACDAGPAAECSLGSYE